MSNKLLLLFLIFSACLTSACLSSCSPKKQIILIDETSGIDIPEYSRIEGEIKLLCENLKVGDQLILLPITKEPWESLGPKIQRIGILEKNIQDDPYKEKLAVELANAKKQVEAFFSALAEDAKQGKRPNASSILEAVKACSKEIT